VSIRTRKEIAGGRLLRTSRSDHAPRAGVSLVVNAAPGAIASGALVPAPGVGAISAGGDGGRGVADGAIRGPVREGISGPGRDERELTGAPEVG
jgi:hypothetical protein